MIADAFAIAGQAMVADAVGAGAGSGIDQLSARLLGWGAITGLLLMGALVLGGSALAGLVDDPIVGALAVSAAAVAGWTMPIGAPLFVADGIFLGLLAFGTIIVSTAFGSARGSTPSGRARSGRW
jgi:Na+-driven multidrug efflux pump